MTAPEDQNGLREALARELIRAKFGEEGVAVLFGIPAEATPHQVAALTARVDQARSEADALIAGPLASLIAERDAALADGASLAANQCEGPMVGDEWGHFHCASLRAAEAEITRLKEGMEAAVGALGEAVFVLKGAGLRTPTLRALDAQNRARSVLATLSPKEQPQ